jgi:hypothetical protein
MDCFILRKNHKKIPMRLPLVKIFLLFGLSFFFTRCRHDHFYIDASGIDAPIQVKRFDIDFFNLSAVVDDDSAFSVGIQQLKSNYPEFFMDWMMRPELMGIGHPDSANSRIILKEILKSSYFKRLMDAVQGLYGDFDTYEKRFSEAYQRYLYYFPGEQLPTIIPFVGNFSMTMNPVGEGYIGVSLDMHMGDTFAPYTMVNPPFEQYFLKLFTPHTILPLHFLALGNEKLGGSVGEKFSDDMLYWGKLLYFTESMLPNVPKHLIIGYSPEQYAFAEQEEKNIWEYFVREELLFSSNKKETMRHFMEGPYTVAVNVPPDAPPMLGKFVGWKMVKKWMEQSKDITLKELMDLTDSELFIRKSKYKP